MKNPHIEKKPVIGLTANRRPQGRRSPPMFGLGIMMALAASMPLAARPATDKADHAATRDARQEESWLSAQLRKFRSYPHLHRAYRLIEKDRLDDAAKEIQACLDIDPADIGVRISYLNVLYRQKRADELLLQAEQVLKQQPDNVRGLLYHGLASQIRGDADAAISSLIRVYQNAFADGKDRAFAASSAADIAMSKGRYGEALDALTVLSAFQNTYADHYRQGAALAAMGRMNDAARAYETALERATNQAEQIQAMSALGYLTQKKGEADKAIRYGEAIVAKDPAHLDWLRTLSDLYHEKRNYGQSERAARLALGVSGAPQDRIRLASVLAERGQHAAAIEQYARAAEDTKDQALSYQASMGLGYAYQALGNEDAAHASFERAAQIKRDSKALAAAAATMKKPGLSAAGARNLSRLLAEYREHHTADGAASIGFAYAQKGEYAKASFYLERALRMKSNPEWLLGLAELYAQAGDTSKAGNALAAYSPVSALDWRRAGDVYWKIGEQEAALAALSKGVDSAGARMQLAQRYLDMQRPDEALHELEAVLRMEPHVALQIQAQRQIGYLHAQAGRHRQAIAAFEAVLAKDGTDLLTMKEQGFVHMRVPDYPQALECFLYILEHENTPSNMLAVARVYSALKQNEPALQYYKMAAAGSDRLSNSDAAALHAELGSLYAAGGRFADASESWSKSAGITDSPEMRMNLAYAEEMLGMPREALARLDALAREPIGKEQELRLLRQYARLHEKMGNIAQAMQYLERVLTLAPSAELHYRIGLYAFKLGRKDAALHHLKEAAFLEPQNPDYLLQFAYLCKDQGDMECAASLFEQVVNLDPKRTSVYQELGYAYSRIGQNDKAIAAFKTAIDGMLDARMRSSLRTYFQEPERREAAAQTALGDDERIYAMRQQVREMSRQFQINAYQSYRSSTRQPNLNATPGFITGGLVPSQGGIEFLYQPPGIGYRDGKTFRLFGRTLWSNEPHSLRIDSKTLQGGIGAEYEPFRDINAYVSLERLLKWGSQSEDNWLVRASWGYSDGYDMKPNRRSWNQSIVYADAGYFLQHDKIRSIYAEARQGIAYNLNNTAMLTPHVTAAVRGQRPDPLDASYLELGAGMSLKYLFNETRYEAARSSAEFIVQYRKSVAGQHASGWVLTTALQF